jgi:hypothetical protein
MVSRGLCAIGSGPVGLRTWVEPVKFGTRLFVFDFNAFAFELGGLLSEDWAETFRLRS